MVGEMFACLLLVVRAQDASTAIPVGLKILTTPRRTMDEKVTRPNPEAIAAGMRLPLSIRIFMSSVDLLAKAFTICPPGLK